MRLHYGLKSYGTSLYHDDVIKWKHCPRYWPFVRGIHRSPVNSPHKGQWRGALMFSLICVWINDWVNNREAGDLRRHLDHYDVSVMQHVISSYVQPLSCSRPFHKSYWKFAQSTAVILRCSVHNFKPNWQLSNKLWTNAIFRYLCSRCVLDGYPIFL